MCVVLICVSTGGCTNNSGLHHHILVFRYSSLPLCHKLCSALLTLFVVVLLPVNAYLATSGIALLIALVGFFSYYENHNHF